MPSLYRQNLIVDLYELTMSAGYFANRMNHQATFELFVRAMPPNRSYLVAAGLAQVVDYLQNLNFNRDEIQHLKSLPVFKNINSGFWDYLAGFRFTGDLWAIPEGQVVFPAEPLLRVTAPIIEAQIIETFLLATINFQTLIASKAARVAQAASLDGKSRGVMEFGSRRAHGPEASLLAARASYLAGCIGTSNVQAGKQFGIPVFGTAAHSWTLAFPTEAEAFRAYYKVFPDSTILLIDTYDIGQGVLNAAEIGPRLKGVRIDSGDLLAESRRVRRILDKHGLQHVQIVASGDLNEYRIEELVRAGAAIDSFGVGTQMVTSEDAPSLGGIYKLVEMEMKGRVHYRAKFSPKKVTYPGRKQVYRFLNSDGSFMKDCIGLPDEKMEIPYRELLRQVLHNGRPVTTLPTLEESRAFCRENIAALPGELLRLRPPATYPVFYSSHLQNLLEQVGLQEK